MINSANRTGTGRSLLAGAGKGAAATATMTGVFRAFERAGWIGQLPPRQIVDRLLPELDDDRARWLTLIAHFGYGTALGSAYALLSRSPSALRGAVFGVAVCLANYELGLPLLRIREPMHRDHPREIAALITAHLVYGAGLGRRVRRGGSGG
ncbi:MAG TPA: hypothetical protein VIP98_01140 [Microlunatus sp.]